MENSAFQLSTNSENDTDNQMFPKKKRRLTRGLQRSSIKITYLIPYLKETYREFLSNFTKESNFCYRFLQFILDTFGRPNQAIVSIPRKFTPLISNTILTHPFIHPH